MVSLKVLRQRINVATKIKQITKSMEMIAASRLKKGQERVAHAKVYTQKLAELVQHLPQNGEDSHPLLQTRDLKTVDLVVVSSSKGLCGSYNSGLFAETDRFLQAYAKSKIHLTLVGKKGVDHYRKKEVHIKDSYLDWDKNFHESFAETLGKKLSQDFLDKKTDAIFIAYSQFITIFSRKVVIIPFLPCGDIFEEKKGVSQKDKEKKREYILEPNAKEMQEAALPRFLTNRLFTILQEAYVVEQAARFVSMQTATTNADEMIDSLTLVRNKVRQANITKEISEIITGAAKL